MPSNCEIVTSGITLIYTPFCGNSNECGGSTAHSEMVTARLGPLKSISDY